MIYTKLKNKNKYVFRKFLSTTNETNQLNKTYIFDPASGGHPVTRT